MAEPYLVEEMERHIQFVSLFCNLRRRAIKAMPNKLLTKYYSAAENFCDLLRQIKKFLVYSSTATLSP